jgi:hypothetical protein
VHVPKGVGWSTCGLGTDKEMKGVCWLQVIKRRQAEKHAELSVLVHAPKNAAHDS